MSEAVSAVIVAVISGAFSLAGFIYGNHRSQSKTLYRIDQLERKQDKHNSLIERVYLLEGEMKVFENQLHNANKRISKIETETHSGAYGNTM